MTAWACGSGRGRDAWALVRLLVDVVTVPGVGVSWVVGAPAALLGVS